MPIGLLQGKATVYNTMDETVPAEITPFPDKPGTEKTGMFRDFFLKTGLSGSYFFPL